MAVVGIAADMKDVKLHRRFVEATAMRGSIALDGYESLQGTSGPQAIFLKADPRAGRPEMPTVSEPHRTASIERRKTVGLFVTLT